MLDKQGHVYLADFGLALLVESGTRGEIFGSPRYIAPEQAISSANVVPQSDLYAVGIMLYEMFTGVTPFNAEDPLDIALLQMSEPPRPPRELRPEISPELEAVILKTLAKEPQERYQSGLELADALDRALGITHQVPALPASPVAHLPEHEARSPIPVPAAVATPLAQPAVDRMTSIPTEPALSAVSTKRKRLTRYISLGIGACVVLAALSGVMFLLMSGRIGDLVEQALTTPVLTDEVIVARATGDVATASTQTAISTSTRAAGITSTHTVEPVLTLSPTPSTTAPPPSSTSVQSATITDVATPIHTPVPTIPLPSPTSIPSATPTDTMTPVHTPTPEPLPSYELLIATRGEDSLFVVNQTAAAFPLAPLSLGNDEGAIDGVEWGIEVLESGECVTVWKDAGNPEPPEGLECERVGERLVRGGRDIFWKGAFNVDYDGQRIGTCAAKPKECSVSIPMD